MIEYTNGALVWVYMLGRKVTGTWMPATVKRMSATGRVLVELEGRAFTGPPERSLEAWEVAPRKLDEASPKFAPKPPTPKTGAAA